MTSAFDVKRAFERAARRLGDVPAQRSRRPRADRGRFRLATAAERELVRLISGQERPPMASLIQLLRAACARAHVKAPSRATVYNYLARVRTSERRVGDLPAPVQGALYNLELDSRVPEAQVAFYCFNYGELGALSYAAGLPWLALYQARRMPGWRTKSRGLIEAVTRVRKI
ncbi:MAG: hypothetical protein JRI68_22825 [Deltaproteobacteria bacterium]|nr:hypothetical protein [Deltaproteobacteria bacterium]